MEDKEKLVEYIGVNIGTKDDMEFVTGFMQGQVRTVYLESPPSEAQVKKWKEVYLSGDWSLHFIPGYLHQNEASEVRMRKLTEGNYTHETLRK